VLFADSASEIIVKICDRSTVTVPEVLKSSRNLNFENTHTSNQ